MFISNNKKYQTLEKKYLMYETNILLILKQNGKANKNIVYDEENNINILTL